MVGRHHRLNGHESEQAPGVGDGQGGLACCSPWGCKESDVTEQMGNDKLSSSLGLSQQVTLYLCPLPQELVLRFTLERFLEYVGVPTA